MRPPSSARSRLPARLRPAVVVAVGLLVASGLQVGATPARAETADQARAQAKAAQAQVDALVPQVKAALTAYQQALGKLGQDVTSGVSAEQVADQAEQAAQAAQLTQVQRVRALYMSGGQAGLLSSVLDSSGPSEMVERIGMLDRVLAAQTLQVRWAQQAAVVARQDANAGLAQADQTGITASDVEARYEAVLGLLDQAQSKLVALSAKAKSLAAAEAAAAELRLLMAQTSAAGSAAAGSASGHAIPPDYLVLYRAAATTCPGLDWHVLAAIGQVESGHGHNVGPSSSGAEGPMQFMPPTFAHYAVDGNGDGVEDIWNPADAIYTAANYLCQNGAGNPRKLYTAIWHYNHADWYVQMVLRVADDLRVKYPI